MKFIFVLFIAFILLSVNPSFIFAQEPVPTPSPNPIQIQWMNEFSVDNQPSEVITILKNFLTGSVIKLRIKGGVCWTKFETISSKIQMIKNTNADSAGRNNLSGGKDSPCLD